MKITSTIRLYLALVTLITGYLGGPSDSLAQVGDVTLYEGATLIVGDGSSIENSSFIVQNGRFSRVGSSGDIEAPDGAVHIDLTGKTVMPTIVDTHTHIGVGAGTDEWLDGQAQRTDLISELHQYAYAGVAVVTSMGWVSEPAFQVRAEYHPNAARLLVSGRGASVPLAHEPETIRRHEAGLPSRFEEDSNDVTSWIHNERQAKLYVRERASQRVDHIKLWVDDRLGAELLMSPEIYGTIIDEAHKHDIPVYAHIWHMRDAKGVVRAGADMLAHPVRGEYIDDEFVRLMKDNNTVQQTNMWIPWSYTITLEDGPTFWEDPLYVEMATSRDVDRFYEIAVNGPQPRTHEGQAPDVDALALNSLIYDRIVRNTARLYDEGVRIALGTEGWSFSTSGGFNGHKTLELLVNDVGLTPTQAIPIATRNSAEALGLNHLGTVEPGKTASFIVLNANPLDEITNTRRIDDVYLYGHRVDREMIRRTYFTESVNPPEPGNE